MLCGIDSTLVMIAELMSKTESSAFLISVRCHIVQLTKMSFQDDFSKSIKFFLQSSLPLSDAEQQGLNIAVGVRSKCSQLAST